MLLRVGRSQSETAGTTVIVSGNTSNLTTSCAPPLFHHHHPARLLRHPEVIASEALHRHAAEDRSRALVSGCLPASEAWLHSTWALDSALIS